jgi:hypothetical protein
MARIVGPVLLACALALALPPAAQAAEFTVWSQEVRVTGDAPGVLVVVLDFWDKPVEVGFGRLSQGRWTYLVRYRESFKAQVYDLTAEELRDLELDVRLRALEQDVAAARGRLQLICDQLRSRVAGCP